MAIKFKTELDKNPHGFYKIPNKIYRDADAVAQSDLGRVDKSLKYYKYVKDKPPEATAAMLFGSIVHDLLLEPDEVENNYIMSDCKIRRGKVFDTEKAQAKEQGKVVMLKKMLHRAEIVVERLKDDDRVIDLLDEGESELSCFAKCPKTGLMRKGRFDHIRSDGTVIDLKTTEDIKPDAFIKSILSWNYHIQAAYYLDLARDIAGNKFSKFVWIVVEKNPDYDIGIYVADEKLLAAGRKDYENLLEMLKLAQTNNDFCGAVTSREEYIDLPYWYYNKNHPDILEDFRDEPGL